MLMGEKTQAIELLKAEVLARQEQIDLLSTLLEQLYVYVVPEAPATLKIEILLALGRDPTQELTLVDVWITRFGDRHIPIIKAIRAAFDIDLQECVSILNRHRGQVSASRVLPPEDDARYPVLVASRVMPDKAEAFQKLVAHEGGAIELRPVKR
jgi:ribosomal protein L7/L12